MLGPSYDAIALTFRGGSTMLRQTIGVAIVLLCAGCSTPSPYNLPPECQDSPLAKATGGILGRTNMAACRAAVDRQGGPMSIMKSPEQLQQEYGARRPQRQQQDMPPMTPEQYQQTQQMMQQMQPMMQQMPQGMMPSGQRPMAQPATGQQQIQPTMPEMTPQQQEQMRRQMQQQMQQQPQTQPPTQ
jgi:hypothetical protein